MRHILLPAVIAIASIPAHCEIWTFSDCVDYARLHNIDLRLAKINESTSVNNLEQAKAQWQPTLDFATSHNYTNSPWGKGTKNSYNSSYGLNASWTVWNGGQREKTIEKDRILTQISALDTEQTFRTIETDMLQVYINILYARESISIFEEASKLSMAQAQRGEALMQTGKISRVDYAQLKSQYEQDNYSLVNAHATYASRCMELKKLLQLGLDSDIEPDSISWTDSQVLASLPDIHESYDLALATDLSLRGLELDKDAAAIDTEIAKASGKPQIALNGGVGTGYGAPGSSFGNGLKTGLSENIGVSLSIPILDNKRTSIATANARLAQEKADLDIEKRQNDISQLVESWYIDTNSAQSQFSAALQKLEAASLSSELTNEKFTLGLVDPIELLTAHNSLTEARHSLLQAKCMAMLGQKMIQYYRTAKVSL